MGNTLKKSENKKDVTKDVTKQNTDFSENDTFVDLVKQMKIKEDVSQIKFIPRNIFGYLDTYRYKIYGDCRRVIIFETAGIYKVIASLDTDRRTAFYISKYESEKIEYVILYPYGSIVKRIPNTLQIITNCKNISIVTNFPHEVY